MWFDFRLANVSISNGNIKYPIGKSIFAVKLPFNLFPANVTNADIGSLKSPHTFLKKCLYHMLVKFEQNRMSKLHEIWSFFDKKKKRKKRKKKQRNKTKQNKKTKNVFLKTIFDKALTPVWKTFLQLKVDNSLLFGINSRRR